MEASPKNFKSAGLILTLAGVGLMVLAVIFTLLTFSHRSSARLAVKTDQEKCIQSIRTMDLEASAADNKIIVQKEGLSQPMFLLSQSSLAINACPGWALVNYCMGSACNKPGLEFTLQSKK